MRARASRRSSAVVVGALALVGILTGCAVSPGGQPSSSPSVAETSAAPGLVGPVILTPQETTGQVELGRMVVFNLGDDPAAWRLEASDPSVLALEPGGERDGATFNWGATTLKVGSSSVVATPTGGGGTVTFEVTVVAS